MDRQADPDHVLRDFESDIAAQRWLDALRVSAAAFLGLSIDALRHALDDETTLSEVALRRGRSVVGLKGVLLSTLLPLQSRAPNGNLPTATFLVDVVEALANTRGGMPLRGLDADGV